MYQLTRLSILTLVLSLILPLTLGATYYVDNTGDCNDNGTGAVDDPWCTLAEANNVGAGDTVFITGTYYETLKPLNSGTEGNLITFESSPRRAAIIDGEDTRAYGIDLSGLEYIRIEGFEIKNCVEVDFTAAAGVFIYGTIQANPVDCYSEIADCYIHDMGTYPTADWSTAVEAKSITDLLVEDCHFYRIGGYGVYATESLDLVCRGNEIHNTGKDGIQTGSQANPTPSNALIEWNFIYDSFGSGAHEDALELWGAYDGLIIRHNTFYDYTQLIYISNPNADSTTYGSPDINNVHIYGNLFYKINYSDYAGIFIDGRGNRHNSVKNIYIHSNTFYNMGYGGIWIFDEDIDGVTVRNNIFADDGIGLQGGYSYTAGAQNIDSDWNLFDDNIYATDRGEEGGNEIIADPCFVDVANWDFRLTENSPAIDAGDTALASVVDRDGFPRDASPDIGAYEAEPACWSYPKQCRGDTDNVKVFNRPVVIADNTLLQNCYGLLPSDQDWEGECMCADFDHSATLNRRVTIEDNNILQLYFGVVDSSVPVCP